MDNVWKEQIDLSSMSQRQRLSSTKISRDLSLATKIRQLYVYARSSQELQKAKILLPGAGICHPMPHHVYRSAMASVRFMTAMNQSFERAIFVLSWIEMKFNVSVF